MNVFLNFAASCSTYISSVLRRAVGRCEWRESGEARRTRTDVTVQRVHGWLMDGPSIKRINVGEIKTPDRPAALPRASR